MDKVVTRDVRHLTHDALLDEFVSLQSQLKSLLEHAHHNQRIMSRHQAFDLKLIGSANLRELLETLFRTLPKISDLDRVGLTLLDPQDKLQAHMQNLGIDAKLFPDLQFAASEQQLGTSGARLKRPQLDAYVPAQHAHCFACPAHDLQSIAVVPLSRRHKLIGTLNLGSKDYHRFSRAMATDFIEHMASIIAICIENVINNEHLTRIGLTDPLTDVSNRRHTDLKLLEEAARARRQRYSIACLYLDVDHFKQINDRYGHACGDDALREVAARIKAELRVSDTLGRFGGEEFVVLLIDAKEPDALQVAQRIRESVAASPLRFRTGQLHPTTISIGVCTLAPEHNIGPYEKISETILKRADHALYQAKMSGRNRVCAA